MRNLDEYHFRILLSNIKRWDKISTFYNFQSNLDSYENIIFLILDIYKSLISKDKLDQETKLIFNQIESVILWNDFSSIIEYSLKTKSLSIIDKINKYDPNIIIIHINNIYNIKLTNIVSAKKIYNLINP